jgi:hypothetical protein
MARRSRVRRSHAFFIPQEIVRMNASVFSMAAPSDAEVFNAFCKQEYEFGSDVTNSDYYFHPFGVPMEEEPFHDLMEHLGEQALASDNPLDLLARYETYLDRCSIRINSLIEAATRYRAMSCEIVMLVNRKQRVRVPAATAATPTPA